MNAKKTNVEGQKIKKSNMLKLSVIDALTVSLTVCLCDKIKTFCFGSSQTDCIKQRGKLASLLLIASWVSSPHSHEASKQSTIPGSRLTSNASARLFGRVTHK